MAVTAFTGCTSQKLPEPTEELVVDFPFNLGTSFVSTATYLAKNYSDPKFTFDYNYTTDETLDTLIRFGLNYASVRGLPGERSEMISILQTYYDEQKNALVKGEAKDIIFADTAFISAEKVIPNDYTKMIKSGAFTDLVPLLSKYAPGLDMTAYEGLLTEDGKLYAVPVYTNSYYLQGAEKVLHQWNFEVNPENDILTFLRKCKAWQDANADDPNAPEVFSKTAWEFLLQHIYSILSTDSIDLEKNTLDLTSAEIKEIIFLLCDLKSNQDESTHSNQESYHNLYGKFLFGRYLGVYDLSVHIQVYIPYLSADHRTVVMPLRNLDGKVNAYAAAYMLVPSNATNQVNVVKFIASYLQARFEEPEKHCFGFFDFCDTQSKA